MTPRHSPTRDFTTRRSGASERNAGVLLLHPRPAPQLRWSSRLLVLARRRPGRRWPSAGSVQLRGHDLHGRPGAAVLGRPGPLLEPAHDHDPAALGQRLGGRWGLAVRPSTVRIRTSPSWEFRADGRPSSRAWEMTYRGTDLLNPGRSLRSAAVGSRVSAGRSTNATAAQRELAQEWMCAPAGTRPGVAPQRTADARSRLALLVSLLDLEKGAPCR
jgi:hypothetical protein